MWYLQRVQLKNIRSFDALKWQLKPEECPGWHVIIGDNGSGKTTFLRAVALALAGEEIVALRQDWNAWVMWEKDKGEVYAQLCSATVKDSVSSPHIRLNLKRQEKHPSFPVSSQWQQDIPLWHKIFSAAYGPFRRFTGGDKESEKLFSTHPRLAAHLSIFGEEIALPEGLRWLQQDLYVKHLENKPEGVILDSIRQFINQPGFLPHQIQLEPITSSGIFFVDGYGRKVTVESLSDGYRSILSVTLDLIRQLHRAYPPAQIFSPDATTIDVPGIVLIDEIDAHLHPSWQRDVGKWFTKHFPKMQFIVSTHSPLICQASEKGSIWRLPAPGEEKSAYRVTGEEWKRLVYGDILEAYSTDLFGVNIDRSEEAQQKLERLTRLNLKALRQTLTESEEEERNRLKSELPSTAYALPETSL